MTPIGDYLRKLLYQYDCIVVGDLGAFLTHAMPAQFSPVMGQYMPPRRKVAFNEALRLDDGILANYVMLHDECTRDVANRRISQFAAEVRQGARSGYTIVGIGLFTLNEEGRLEFDPELRHNFNGESFGLQPITVAPVKIVVPGPILSLLPAPELLTSPEDTTTVSGVVVPLHPGRRIAWRWAAAAILVGSLGFVSYYSLTHPGQSLQSSLNPASLFRIPSLLAESKTGRPTPVASTEKSLISAPALPAVAEKVMSAPMPTPATTTSVSEVKPEVVAPAPETVVVHKSATKARVHHVVKPTGPLPKFVVVAGSFASKSNALRFRRTLRHSGFGDAYIIPPGKGGKLYKVAAVGTQELLDAESNADSLGRLTGIPAWIFRFNQW